MHTDLERWTAFQEVAAAAAEHCAADPDPEVNEMSQVLHEVATGLAVFLSARDPDVEEVPPEVAVHLWPMMNTFRVLRCDKAAWTAIMESAIPSDATARRETERIIWHSVLRGSLEVCEMIYNALTPRASAFPQFGATAPILEDLLLWSEQPERPQSRAWLEGAVRAIRECLVCDAADQRLTFELHHSFGQLPSEGDEDDSRNSLSVLAAYLVLDVRHLLLSYGL